MNLTDPYIFRNQSLAVRLSLVVAANVAYALIFNLLYPFAGDGIGPLAIIPAAFSGWLLGVRLGLLAGLLTGLLNQSLYSVIAGYSFASLIILGLPSLLIAPLGGGIGGWLSDLLCQLKKQTHDLTQKQSNIQEEIIKHQHVEKELRHQQEILQSIFDNIPLMIAFYDSTGKLLFLSRELERALGWSMEELRQIDLLAECYPDPKYRQKVIEFMIVATREWRDFKTRTKDGRIIDTAWANVRLSDGSNIGIGQDITERKQAEEKLETMRHRYELATQAGNVGVWDRNLQTDTLYLDPNVKMLLGYQDEEIPNDLRIWLSHIHPEDRKGVLGAVQAHLDGQTPEYNFEHRMVHKDGSNRWIFVRGTAIRDAEGQALRLIGTNTDITERKQVEKALRESEERFRNAFEYSLIGMVLMGTDGSFLQVNTALSNIMGYTVQELENLNVQAITHPDDVEQSLIYINQVLAGEINSFQQEKRYLHRDGHTIWAAVSASVVHDHQGQVLHFVIQVQDITERKRAETERIQFINQLQTAAEISKHLNTILDPDLLLQEVVTLLQIRFNLYHVHIYLLDEATMELRMEVGTGEIGRQLREQGHKIAFDYEQSLVAQAARRQETILVNDTHSATNFLANPLLPQTQAEVAVPIIAAGRLLGVLDVQDNRKNRFSQSDLDSFSALSGQIAIALENANLFDQTKQAQAVLELRDRAIAASSNGILIVDATQPDLPVNFVNPAFEQITGYTAAETVGRNCRFLQGKETRQPALDELRAAIKAGRSCTVLLRNYRKDGTLFWNQLSISPIYDNDVLTHFVGIQVDVTDQKRAEEELRESEEKWRSLVENAPDLVMLVDRDYNIQFINRTTPGFTIDQVIGTKATDYISPEYQQVMIDCFDEVFRTSQPGSFETAGPGFEGMTAWYSTSVGPVKLHDKIVALTLISTDITNRKQTEEALALARDQALEASRLKSQILAKVSHELRTPLNGILGFAEMLEFGTYGPITARQQDATNKIIKSTHYLTEVVGELLDQAQLESGKVQLSLTTFAPKDIIERVQTETTILAKMKNLNLTTEIASDTPDSVCGDPARVRQVLSNLVGNAIKFTEQGSVCVKVYCPDEMFWAIQVSDTGPGIPLPDQAKIFEPFHQVDGSLTRKYAGYGLGLSIVKQLTTMMGGQIKLKSKVGQGSTFTVLLPLQGVKQ